MAKKTRYVAYSNLANHKSGAEVDPADFGGEDSEDFQYMLERRTIVPLGDPDAPAPPDEEEEAPVEEEEEAPAASSGGGAADPTVRQPGQPPASVDPQTGAVTKSTTGSSPTSPQASAAAKPAGGQSAG